MKIYIAGPMTGYPKYNFPMFDECKVYLEKLLKDRFEVISPADLNRADGIDENSEVDNALLRKIFAKDVQEIATCDLMVMLPRWQLSCGAKIEYQIAHYLGISVNSYEPGSMHENNQPALLPLYDPWFEPEGLFGKSHVTESLV